MACLPERDRARDQRENAQRLAVQDAWLAVHEPELLKEVEESAQALAAANTLTGAQRGGRTTWHCRATSKRNGIC